MSKTDTLLLALTDDEINDIKYCLTVRSLGHRMTNRMSAVAKLATMAGIDEEQAVKDIAGSSHTCQGSVISFADKAAV